MAHSCAHARTNTHTQTHTHTPSLSHTLSLFLTRTHTHTLSLSLSLSLSHTHTHTHTFFLFLTVFGGFFSTSVMIKGKYCLFIRCKKLLMKLEKRNDGQRIRYIYTVLSGAEERGADGPSLDRYRSYFSRLQPISFLFYNPSSGHVG